MNLPSSYQPDGINQLDVLLGKATTVREKPLFWKSKAPWPAQKSKPDHWVSYAMADQQWKLVANNDSSYLELYNIVKDPYEKNDLQKSKPEVVKTLLKKLDQWKKTLPEKPSGDVFSNERSK